MATVVLRKLSGSTDGKAIKVVQTATAGDTIHTAVAGTTPGTFDQIYLYAYNGHTAAVTLTLEVGGATVPDNNIVVTLASKSGSIPVILGDFNLQNGAVIKAFASVANVVTLHGYVLSNTD